MSKNNVNPPPATSRSAESAELLANEMKSFVMMDEEGLEEQEARDQFPMDVPDNIPRRHDSAQTPTVPNSPDDKGHVQFLERSFSEPSSPQNSNKKESRRRTMTGWRHPPGFKGGFGSRPRARRLSRQLTRQFTRTGSHMRHISERTFSTVDPNDENPERGTWSNQFEFFLSCLGYAVGLGNVWRFPYLCHENGGGAFLIPYMLMLTFCGLPMLLLELSLGQYSSEGPISIWKMAPLFKGLGVGMVIISLFLASYYNMITGWAIYYLYSSFTTFLPWTCCSDSDWASEDCVSVSPECRSGNYSGDGQNKSMITTILSGVNGGGMSPWNLTTNLTVKENFTFSADDYFHKIALVMSEGIDHMGTVQMHLFIALTVAWLIVFLVLMRGIKSVGKIVYFTSLFPYVVLTILLIRAIIEPGALKGVMYYLTPKWEKLLTAKVWGDAVTQIFFSTSVCTGGVITLASYNRFHNNVYRDAVIIGIGNSLTSIFSGFVVFSILGFMAHKQGCEVKDIVEGGPGLTFIIYPQAVTLLPLSPFWSILFFLMLITLALSSMFPTVENITTAIIDQFPSTLRPYKFWLTLVTCVLLWLVGISMTCNGGIYVLLLLDKYAVGFALVIVGFVEVFVFAWLYGTDRILDNMEHMIGFRPSRYWHYIWRYVCPTLLTFSLLFTWIDYKPLDYQDKLFPVWANVIGWCMSFIPFMAIIVVALIVYFSYDTHMAWTKGRVGWWQVFRTKIREMTRPDPTWGPALAQNREMMGPGEDQVDDVFEHG